MTNINIYWVLAGFLNLVTAGYFILVGKEEFLGPILNSSDVKSQTTIEILGVWFMVAVLLFVAAAFLLKKGFTKEGPRNTEGAYFIGIIYCFSILTYSAVMEMMHTFTPQPFFLLPIGILVFIGIYKENNTPPKETPDQWDY